jgi:hypothetical protein
MPQPTPVKQMDRDMERIARLRKRVEQVASTMTQAAF